MKTASSLFGWIGRGLLKILKFLLLRLGLWVPVAYSLLFVIVTAVTRTSFSAVWGVYVFGLCVTCVFAVAVACLGFMHRADRKSSAAKRSSGYVQGMTPVDNNVQYVEGAQGGQIINQPPQSGENQQQPAAYAQQQQNQPQNPQQPYQPQQQQYSQPYQPQQPYQQQPYPQQSYQQQPYRQPYQSQQSQPQPQNNDFGFGRDYDGGFGRGERRDGDFGRGFDGGDKGVDGKPDFLSYNIDREPQKPEYTGGDPGFLSYYPERDQRSETDFGGETGARRVEPSEFSGRGDRDFSSDSGFSAREEFSRSDSRDFTARDDFSGGGERGFGREESARRDSAIPFQSAPHEKPAIFRTRMDASMLIYEYSDRLEFYKVTAKGPVLVSVEYKNPGGLR